MPARLSRQARISRVVYSSRDFVCHFVFNSIWLVLMCDQRHCFRFIVIIESNKLCYFQELRDESLCS